MGDDHHAIDSQQRAAAITFVGHAGRRRLESGLQQTRQGLAGQGGGELFLEHGEEGFGRSFAALEEDVAHKSVANRDVQRHVQDIAAFHVSFEIQKRHHLEQFENFLAEFTPFAFLLTIAHQPYHRAGYLVDRLGEDMTHHRMLQEMDRLAVHISPGIDQPAGAVEIRKRGKNAGTFDAGQGGVHAAPVWPGLETAWASPRFTRSVATEMLLSFF